MQSYCFKCYETENGCGHSFEVMAEMSQIIGLKPKCPKCRKQSPVFRDYQPEQVSGINQTPQTLGSLAEKNTTKYSKDQREAMTAKFNEYLTKPYNGPTPEGAISSEEAMKQAEKNDERRESARLAQQSSGTSSVPAKKKSKSKVKKSTN